MNRIFFTSLFFLTLLLTSFSNDNDEQRNNGKFVVVLDAGHGGHDPGNLGNGYLEKNIALNIVLNVGKILETKPDIKVIYTRKEDKFVDLYVRGEIANKANADLFVSVHCDSHSSDAHGAGTFVLGLHANKQNFEIAKKENSVIYLEDNYEDRYADYDINSPESIIGLTIMQEEFLDQSIALAKLIQDNFTGELKRNNRKVKQAGFIVLHQTFMPSVLVETGFLTNKSEGSFLNSKAGQRQMGTAIAEAIIKYKSAVQANIAEQPQETPEIEMEQKEEKPKEKEVVQMETVEAVENKATPSDQKLEEAKTKVVEKEPEAKEVKKPESDTPIQKAEEEKKITKPIVKTNKPDTRPKVIFKVQIMASEKDLDLKPQNFKGLSRISREPYKNLFRYMYGITNSYEEAKMLKANADVKGYTSSYIVAYREGVRIPMTEALKYATE
ncbi:MAG: N-acetylmuramoyl-L-alanine amidase [Maribacter sp.]|nr:N-acetylmuramoyl-L-alanine amidase [Maribacter sp.]